MSTDTTSSRLEVNPQFAVLDSLRAIGALAVLTTHVAFQSGAYVRDGTWGAILSRLDVGVAIFFVLSGFLLSRPYFARRAATLPHPGTGRYYWKRLLRIYPVYIVTVVLALTLIPENDGLSVTAWVHTLTMTNIYSTTLLPQGLTQMWSLAVEVSFYAVLPLLMFLALGRRGALRPVRVTVLLAAMVALSCWWHLGLAATVDQHTDGTPAQWLPAYLSWFAVGIGLALAHVLDQTRERPPAVCRTLDHLAGSPGVCWTAVAGLMLVASTPLAGPTLLYAATDAESLTKHALYAVIGGLVVLTGIRAVPDSRYAHLMSAPLPRHIGHISYSVFCIHLPILYLVMQVTDYPLFGGHTWQIWCLTVVLSLAASEVLYRVVELPAMRLKNLRLRRSPRTPPTTPPTTKHRATNTA
ncbi:acyltransferase [Nocardioides caricicola]|uniref:Acyltransferase family protein n=1 Tax=Nocardioides caricicola TaxID=634770 RepID=A0ABW0MXC7_9ACTN